MECVSGADRTPFRRHLQLIKCQMRWNRKRNPSEEAGEAGLIDVRRREGGRGSGATLPFAPGARVRYK